MSNTQQKPMDISTQLYNNVKKIAKLHGRKLGDLETSIGLTKGYFWRCRKNHNSPRLEPIYTLAGMLGVSIEDLITDAYRKQQEEEQARKRISEVITSVQDVLNREEIIRTIREEMGQEGGE